VEDIGQDRSGVVVRTGAAGHEHWMPSRRLRSVQDLEELPAGMRQALLQESREGRSDAVQARLYQALLQENVIFLLAEWKGRVKPAGITRFFFYLP
jgi:hypothetical protein